MNFGMNFPTPDPERLAQAIENIRTAFETAAGADTGSAQPLFQKLSDTFNKVVAEGMNAGPQANPAALMKQLMPVVMQLQTTIAKIQQEAARNPAVASVMQDLETALREEISALIPGLPPSGPSGRSPKNIPPQKKPTPKKPNNGDFKL